MPSAIEWTDETWNPVVGCTKVSQGCKFCYAKTLHDRRHRAALAGKTTAPQYQHPFETVQLMPARLNQPLTWRRPRRVFVNSVSDLFHEAVPDDFLDKIFLVMSLASKHQFQILTKRSERMRQYMSQTRHLNQMQWPLPNVWLGVSVENEEAASQRIGDLMLTPAAVRFLSCEPLLGPVDLRYIGRTKVDWVIVGGESGPRARNCNIGFVRDVVRQCQAARVAVFVKQLGAHPVCDNMENHDLWPCATVPYLESYSPQYQGEIAPLSLHDAKGGDIEEWPVDLRIREFPV